MSLIELPSPKILSAAFNSHGDVRFGAAAFDEKGNLLGIGWNGAVTPEEQEAALPLQEWLRGKAEKQGFDPERIHLVRNNGYHRIMHAEMRLLNNVAEARGKFSDIFRIATLRTVPVHKNGKYFGVRKFLGKGNNIWSTCAPCGRVLQITGTLEEMQTTKGWIPIEAKTTVIKATTERHVPHNFWDQEIKAVTAQLMQYDRKDQPATVETDFMVWHRLPANLLRK